MSSPLSFKVLKKDTSSGARIGELKTLHGTFKTPIFMPVGTKGDVKCLTNKEVHEVSSNLILANTYHLFLSPGMNLLNKVNGLRNWNKWDGAILTDSGGYQVFSLSKTRKITEDGVFFKHYKNGSTLFMSPEISVHMQNAIGADIMMSFDECPPFDSAYPYMKESVERTIRWAKRGKDANLHPDTQALFGIVQGGPFKDLRKFSVDELQKIGFDGYSIGGLSVGESKDERIELDVVAESLDKRYLLVGECKWTTKERSDRLLLELRDKAEKLPFAKKHIIITKLFLKNPPIGTQENVFLPDDMIKYQ